MNKQTIIVMIVVFIVTACKKDKTPPSVPVVTTEALTNITTTSATASGAITSNGGANVTASGVVWSNTNNTPTLADSVIVGTANSGSVFTINLTNLQFNQTYYVRAFATNSVGTGYGNVVTLTTANDTFKVRFMYNGQEVTYGIISSAKTGRKWMDRNLGASRVALAVNDTAAYGHFFQWGRPADGHQIRTSSTTDTLSTSDVPGHSSFITVPILPRDWRSDNNINRWQTNTQGPCPPGWHVPTQTEWNAELGTDGITNSATAMNLFKLPAGGSRKSSDGTFTATAGSTGGYWSSTVDASYNIYSIYLNFISSFADATGSSARATGYCVRCIKD